jgi:hypothetical protein
MGLVSDHPVCGVSVASRLNAAASPPHEAHEEGNVRYFQVSFIHGTARRSPSTNRFVS